MNAETLMKRLLETRLFNGRAPTIKHHYTPGKDNIVLCTGENASGKSLVRRLVEGLCARVGDKIECISLSMEDRSGGSLRTYGIMRSMIYGDENRQATGINSAKLVTTAFRTSQNRDGPHILLWDEPEIGMAEGAAIGLGLAIDQFEAPEHLQTMVVITHSKPLVRGLLADGTVPHFLHLRLEGSDPIRETPEDWLHAEPNIVLPEELYEKAKAANVRISKRLRQFEEEARKGKRRR